MSSYWKIYAAIFLMLELALHTVCSGQIANTESANWNVSQSSRTAHRTAWRQAETVIRDYTLTTDGSTPLDLSTTNLVILWDVVAYTNIAETWIAATGIVTSGTSGQLRVSLTPEESNLATGYYYGFVKAVLVDGENTVTSRLVTIPQVIEVRYSTDERYTAFRGPLSYQIPTIDTNALRATAEWLEAFLPFHAPSVVADDITLGGVARTNWPAGGETDVGPVWEYASNTHSIATGAAAIAESAYTLADTAETTGSAAYAEAQIAQTTGAAAHARADLAYGLAEGAATQGHTHVVADVTDFPVTWPWDDLTDVPDIIPDAPSNGTQYARQDGTWAAVAGGGNLAATNTPEEAGQMLYASGTDNETLYWADAPEGGGMDPAIASNSFIWVDGRNAMLEALRIDAPAGLVITNSTASSSVYIGNVIHDGSIHLVGIGAGVRVASGVYSGVGIGRSANAQGGIAVGESSYAAGAYDIAVGPSASAYLRSVAVGSGANAANTTGSGVAAGYNAIGGAYGVAVGEIANGLSYGTALGSSANAARYGVAVGRSANAVYRGIALGVSARGTHTNIAVGASSYAGNSALQTNRIAIGTGVSNSVNDSVALRGDLYLDGGTNRIFYRPVFGTGEFFSATLVVITNAYTGGIMRLATDNGHTWMYE